MQSLRKIPGLLFFPSPLGDGKTTYFSSGLVSLHVVSSDSLEQSDRLCSLYGVADLRNMSPISGSIVCLE